MEHGAARVLVVDNQPQVAEIIRKEVSASGFECVACDEPAMAVRLLREKKFSVLVTDLSMPDLAGMNLLAQVRQSAPECTVILITAHSSLDYLGQALMLGAFDYLEKPFDPADVAELVRRAVRGDGEVALLPARAAESIQPGSDAKQSALDSVRALVRAVEAKDPYTRRHSEHVAHYATDLAEAMGVRGEELESVRVASLLHDVGKIGVPDTILTKPDSLTAEEFKHIQRHPELGEAILSKMTVFKREAMLIRHHHERWDGNGYPDGLSGEESPFTSRIMCVADSIDAMLMERTYKQRCSVEKMLGELERCAGTQFDPRIAVAAVEWCRRNPEGLILPDRAPHGDWAPAA